MFSLFKKKPVITEQPTPEVSVEPEVRYPKNVALVKNKIDRLKGKIDCKIDYSYGKKTIYTIGKIEIVESRIYGIIYTNNLAIKLSRSDTKELYEYLEKKREKQVQKELKKKERETLNYLKS